MIKQKLTLILVITIFVISAHGQDTNSYNLDTLIAFAVKNNHNVQITRNNVEVAKNNASLSNAGILPEISLSGNASLSSSNTKAEFSGNIPTSEQKGAKSINYGGGVEMSRTLFQGFYAVNKYKKLKSQAELSDIRLQTEIENTIVAVTKGYYTYIAIVKDYNIASANLSISKERLEKIEDNVTFGQSNKNERLNAQSALNADSIQLLNLENQKKKAFHDLLKSLGKENINIADIDSPKSSLDLLLLDYKQLKSKLEENNKTLKQAYTNLGISQLEYKMTKASRFPNITLSTGYGYNQQEFDVGVMTYNRTLGFDVGFSVSYNLFDFGQRKRNIQNAKIAVQNEKLNIDNMELQIYQDFEKAWSDYELQLNTIEMEKQNLANEKERFKSVKDKYYLGQTDHLTFRDAQLSLARAKSQLFNARINAKLAELELLRLSGALVR